MSEAAERARKLWSLGEYERVAPRLDAAGAALVEACGVAAGMRVLDVAAGNGNVAVAAASRGAEVTASDIAPAMVARGRERTASLSIAWEEADVQDLPHRDGAFNCVLSAFGAMFAPDPVRAAAEMLRVCAPGGVVGMTTWVVEGIQGACQAVLSEHLPAQALAASAVPDAWGEKDVARGHFEAHGAQVSVERRTLHWTFERAEAWLEFMERGAPPVVAVRGLLGEERWEQVRPKLLDAVRRHGRADASGFVVEPGYLLITARRPARARPGATRSGGSCP